MKIIKAKTAGFCFGVDRAVKLTYGLLEQGVRVATLGPLIHNPQCVADLAARGAVTVDTPEQVPDGYEGVVRSHGVPQCICFCRFGGIESTFNTRKYQKWDFRGSSNHF